MRRSTLICLVLGLILTLGSCQPQSDQTEAGEWQVYQNARFGFEFPYPSHWVSSIPPENRDGIAFGDPQNPEVEIRGWANNVPAKQPKKQAKPLPQNFTTAQGLPGNLNANLGTQTSSLTLTLDREGVRYFWRGSAPSGQFDRYYRLFSYIASQFRLSASRESRSIRTSDPQNS